MMYCTTNARNTVQTTASNGKIASGLVGKLGPKRSVFYFKNAVAAMITVEDL